MSVPPITSPTVAFFGHDATENVVVKRGRAFRAEGVEVVGFTFRRGKLDHLSNPEWPNVDLGATQDLAYSQRFFALLRAVVILLGNRRLLRTATFFYARNMDMCVLAILGRLFARTRAPIVYEVLDIHKLLTTPGVIGASMRFLERQLLRRIDLLVVSSPAFVSEYFIPCQGYKRPWYLFENMVAIAAEATPEKPVSCELSRPKPAGERRPWLIGWFGTLRCPESLMMLRNIAQRLPDRVEIRMRGYPSTITPEEFAKVIHGVPNVAYGGKYKSPDDLQQMYDSVDFVWGFDFYEKGKNSNWLLPNRLYEAGLYGRPILAARNTETGRKVDELGLGWTFDEPYEQNLIEFLATVSDPDIDRVRAHILELPRSLFMDVDQMRGLLTVLSVHA